MKLSELKLNPNNPRFIRSDRFEKLVKSIKEFPKMLELRPIIYDPDTMYSLGGNMRHRALIELGYKEIPDNWVKSASELTEDEKKRFTIVDNISFGEFSWDDLANEWEQSELTDWGVELPVFRELEEKKEQELTPFNKSHILISFDPDQLIEIEKHIEEIKKIGVEIEIASN